MTRFLPPKCHGRCHGYRVAASLLVTASTRRDRQSHAHLSEDLA